MDDSCAVCAEPLEWVAYGPCGHREVCSTCVSRLRFICEDRRCCICKTESDTVFVTKALGDYTTTISDFSVFPSDSTEGRNGSYWYHEDTGAYFDDSDQYKMVKAMCRLSCSVCDKAEEQGVNDGSRRKGKYRNIEQLKSHLFHRHKLFMCSLCLEGRKIFICEQKLYTRAQLTQHINTGDSEVDGSESERGGFNGHPMCEFCKKPFYGDNELYSHMSTEHFTCHICQRQHPGQFEYYKNYDDLEMHFRSLHFLCEDEACLAKKFIVFTSESEMKRHNAIEHGGHMSRSKRNAVLQIPTSFRYRRYNEENRRGRGRGRGFGFRSDSAEMSSEPANSDYPNYDSLTSTQPAPNQRETSNMNPDEIIAPFESLSTTDSEGSSRYRQAVRQSSVPLQESAFPPLPAAPVITPQRPQYKLSKKSMAARLKRVQNGTVNVLNPARAWPVTNLAQAATSSSTSTSTSTNTKSQAKPTPNHSRPSPSSSSAKAPSSSSSSSSSANSAQPQPRPVTSNGVPSASSSSWNTIVSTRSFSSPNLVEKEKASSGSSMEDFPPVSLPKKKLPVNNTPQLKVEDVQTANKTLVERIRSGLDFDEDKYSAFREISAEFKEGAIGTVEYLSYVQQFGLSHLVLELARLCPDSQKQRELLDTYNASVRSERERENGSSINKGSNKGKGKYVETSGRGSKETLTDNILSTVKKLQASYKPVEEEEVEVLSKDGYRRSNGKAPSEQPGGGGKQRKKTPKFTRVRLGEGFDRQADEQEERSEPAENGGGEGVVPVRGVWRTGGAHKLF